VDAKAYGFKAAVLQQLFEIVLAVYPHSIYSASPSVIGGVAHIIANQQQSA
jgi:hypothetical protein